MDLQTASGCCAEQAGAKAFMVTWERWGQQCRNLDVSLPLPFIPQRGTGRGRWPCRQPCERVLKGDRERIGRQQQALSAGDAAGAPCRHPGCGWGQTQALAPCFPPRLAPRCQRQGCWHSSEPRHAPEKVLRPPPPGCDDEAPALPPLPGGAAQEAARGARESPRPSARLGAQRDCCSCPRHLSIPPARHLTAPHGAHVLLHAVPSPPPCSPSTLWLPVPSADINNLPWSRQIMSCALPALELLIIAEINGNINDESQYYCLLCSWSFYL